MPLTRVWPIVLFLFALAPTWGQERILYLKSGDALEGTVAGETERAISLKLRSGVIVTIDRDQIDSVETPESIAELQKEFHREAPADVPDLDLRDVFQAVNPTPTPIPIRRLGPLQVRKKFRATEYRASLLPKDLGAAKQEPMRALPMIPEQDEEGNRNFGVVTYLEAGPKVRRGSGGWEILERDQLLNPGDEINTLEGRVEITTQKGNLVRLEPNTEFLLERNKAALKRGRVWLQSFSKNLSAADVGNIAVRLQPSGLLHLETLRSGNKISLLDGQVRINNLPETPRLLRTVQGPSTVWIDGVNILTSEEEVEPVHTARWEEWQRKVLDFASPQSFGAGLSPEVSLADLEAEQTKDLLLLIADALTRHHLDLGSFPVESGGPALEELFKNRGNPAWRGPYLIDIPFPLVDTHGNELVYRVFTPEGETEAVAGVYSAGPNRQFEEGDGDDLGILVPAPSPQAN